MISEAAKGPPARLPALVAAAAALFPAPAPAASPSVDRFRGNVSYRQRGSCQASGTHGIPRPLTGAKVMAIRGSDKDADSIDPNGDYKLFLDGSGPAKA